jgi:hypothetical protein
MTDFRRIERELIDALDAAGVDISRKGGDAFATLIPVPECGNPEFCKLVVGPYGKTECELCEFEHNLNSRMVSISITELAKRLSSE